MKDLKVMVIDAVTQEPVADAEIATHGREATKVTTDQSGVGILAVASIRPCRRKTRCSRLQ